MKERIRKWLFPELEELRELYYALDEAVKRDISLGGNRPVIVVGTVKDAEINGDITVTGTGSPIISGCYMNGLSKAERARMAEMEVDE